MRLLRLRSPANRWTSPSAPNACTSWRRSSAPTCPFFLTSGPQLATGDGDRPRAPRSSAGLLGRPRAAGRCAQAVHGERLRGVRRRRRLRRAARSIARVARRRDQNRRSCRAAAERPGDFTARGRLRAAGAFRADVAEPGRRCTASSCTSRTRRLQRVGCALTGGPGSRPLLGTVEPSVERRRNRPRQQSHWTLASSAAGAIRPVDRRHRVDLRGRHAQRLAVHDRRARLITIPIYLIWGKDQGDTIRQARGSGRFAGTCGRRRPARSLHRLLRARGRGDLRGRGALLDPRHRR